MNVYVTARDLEEGRRKSCVKCPLARAIGRRLKPKYYVRVGSGSLAVREMTATMHRHLMELPPVAVKFVHDFDRKKKVSPQRFVIDIPEEYCV